MKFKLRCFHRVFRLSYHLNSYFGLHTKKKVHKQDLKNIKNVKRCRDGISLVYPGHVGGGKSGLVSTVCACAYDSGNLLQTSPIMDKLHMIVMRRNNQTRYTACSVAVCLRGDGFHLCQRHKLTRGDTTRTTLQPPPVPPSLCL